MIFVINGTNELMTTRIRAGMKEANFLSQENSSK
jgi:hypothetical protein